jgi:hypothetical protein
LPPLLLPDELPLLPLQVLLAPGLPVLLLPGLLALLLTLHSSPCSKAALLRVRICTRPCSTCARDRSYVMQLLLLNMPAVERGYTTDSHPWQWLMAVFRPTAPTTAMCSGCSCRMCCPKQWSVINNVPQLLC